MSFYVYGFRIAGDPECRYVGQTGKSPAERLTYLTTQAKAYAKGRGRGWQEALNPDCFDAWLIDNEGNIETFKIAKFETREQALAAERTIIALTLRFDHRLFNSQHVPRCRRMPEPRIRIAA